MIQKSQDLLTEISYLKTQLDSLRPFDDAQLRNLRQWFHIWFTHHSNAIEGNTLSLTEVKVLLEDGITIWGKTVQELQETINHGQILTQLHDCFDRGYQAITGELILQLHNVLMQGIVEDQYRWVYRTINIRVTWSDDEFPAPNQVDSLMGDYLTRIHNGLSLEEIARTHYDFVKIHPFVDGNGRIARLLMNIALINEWYFPIIIPILLRQEYIDSLKGDDFTKRYEFFLWQVYENHKDYLRFVTNH